MKGVKQNEGNNLVPICLLYSLTNHHDCLLARQCSFGQRRHVAAYKRRRVSSRRALLLGPHCYSLLCVHDARGVCPCMCRLEASAGVHVCVCLCVHARVPIYGPGGPRPLGN